MYNHLALWRLVKQHNVHEFDTIASWTCNIIVKSVMIVIFQLFFNYYELLNAYKQEVNP